MFLIKKMRDIADTLSAYDNSIASAEKDWERAKSEADSLHARNIQDIQATRDANVQAANQRKSGWEDVLNNAQRHMKNMKFHLDGRLIAAACSDRPLTRAISDTESIQILCDMNKEWIAEFCQGDNDRLISLAEEAKVIMSKFESDAEAVRSAMQAQYSSELSYTQKLYAGEKADEEIRYIEEVNQAQALHQQRISSLHEELENAFNTTINPQQSIRANYDTLVDMIPKHENYAPPTTFPDNVCFGYAGYDITEYLNDEIKKQVLLANCSDMIAKEGKRSYIQFPYGYGFSDRRFSSMFEFDLNSRDLITQHMQSLVLRLMMSTPCNKAWLTLIDPIELGKTFAMFAPWGEIEERVIDTRIWHDEARIEERLQNIIDHTSDVNFRCLQGRFENILEYNKSAGKNAEPLRFLVIMDFPRHFTSAALDKLESIVTNGPSTGVFALIAADVNAMKESMDPAVQRIREKMNVFSLHKGAFFTSDRVNNKPIRFIPMLCTGDSEALETIKKIGDGIKQAEKIVITTDDVYSPDMQMMSFDASNGISVPIGLEGANKRVELKLGGVSEGGRAHSYHAMISGSIGAGKSNMLHNIILGTLLSYNPSEVQMYLVDMKDGVEFKRYAQHMRLANLRVVAIDAEKEFGLSVLQELVSEQWLRGQKFKETGTDRIETYNAKMRRENRLNEIMPRLVVVMDEIQWMFDNAENQTTKECAKLLETLILMGGSAFGIQIILATQDWANVQGLKESIYNNIGVRIVLKSTQASAQIILSSDNEIVSRVVTFDAGQAVFNEYAGHKDYNHEFRGMLIPQDEMHKSLGELEQRQKQYGLKAPSRQRLLSSDVQDNDDNALNIFAKQQKVIPCRDMGYRLWLGESLGMVNTFIPSLASCAGQNLLLLGSKEGTASSIAGYAAMSALIESIRLEETIEQPVITVFDFSNRQVGIDQIPLLQTIADKVPDAFRVFRSKDAVDGLRILENEINTNSNAPQQIVIIFGINRARRFTEGGMYTEKPRDILARLLRIGPENGVNFIVWANAPAMFKEFYGDTLGEFEMRMVFEDVEDELYPYYVQDKKSETADERNALSYDMDGDNQLIKLYSRPSDKWIEQFADAVQPFIKVK